MCSVLAFVSSPTDDGLAAGFVSRAARSRASRSRESHPPSSAGPTSAGHPADHAFVSGSRLPESSPDDPPGTRSLTLPVVPKTTAWLRWLRSPQPPGLPRQRKTRTSLPSWLSVFSVSSPVSVSTIAMDCCFACRSHPCILFASPRFGRSVLMGNWIGFRREADRILRRISSAAWILDRPPALLSHAVENPRPLEPAFTRSAREMVQGRGAGTQSNPDREDGYDK